MRPGVRCSPLWILLSTALLANPFVHAQNADRAQKADALYSQGNQHFRAGDWKAGIKAMESAYALNPEPRFVLNIAIAYHSWGGHCAEALKTFERYYTVCGVQACPNKGAADSRQQQVKAKCLVPVDIESAPSGASLSVDDAPSGKAPTTLKLLPGTHMVRAELKGHQAAGLSVTVRAGQKKSVKIRLQETVVQGTLRFTDVPEGATVAVDGRPLADTQAPIDVSPGTHEVEVVAPPAEPRTLSVKVSAGAERVVSLKPAPPKPPPPPPGTVVPPPPESNLALWGWATAGLGVAALVAGGAYHALSFDSATRHDEASTDGETPLADLEDLQSDSESEFTIAIVGYTVGGLAVATGVTLLLLDRPAGDQAGSVSWTPVLGPGGVGLAGRF